MIASIRTRDGSVSTAALMQQQEDMAGQAVPASTDEVTAWGRQNGVTLTGRDSVRKVNARRRSLNPPPFVVTDAEAVCPGTRLPGALAEPAVAAATEPAKTLPPVGCEQEFRDLVAHHAGTLYPVITQPLSTAEEIRPE